MDPILRTEALCFDYKTVKGINPSLRDVTLEFDPAKKTAVMGANGAGKSTLFSLLVGLKKPKSGTVYFDGEPIGYHGKRLKALRSGVTLMLQNPDNQLFMPKVRDDVAYGPTNLGLKKEEVDARVAEALMRAGIEDLADKSTMKLSYGQRKRVTLAGVLAMRPKVMIMDEPTAGLDPQMASEVMEIAEQMHGEGTSVVLSSHDADLVYAWADDIKVLRHGKLVYNGSQEGFYRNVEETFLSGLLPPNPYALNRGLSGSLEPYPKTEVQLLAKMLSSRTCGRIGVVVIDGTEPREALEERVAGLGLKGAPAGVAGLAARKSEAINTMAAEWWFDAVDGCFRTALSGKDSVLFCDKALIGAVKANADFFKGVGKDVELVWDGPTA